MAFGQKNKSSGSKGGFGNKGGRGGEQKKATFKKIGSLMNSEKYSKTFFSADTYHGTLLYLVKPAKGSDEEPKLFKVKTCNFQDRDAMEDKGIKNLPESLVGNISLNLDNAEEVDLAKVDSLDELFESDND